MYLKQLIEFANREQLLETAIPGYAERKINWIIRINQHGDFEGCIPMPKGTKGLVPYQGRSGSNLPPFLLYDKVDFVLGWISDEKQVERTKRRHQAFRDLVTTCAKETNEPLVIAVDQFFQKNNVRDFVLPEMKDGHWMTFQIENEKPIDLSNVRSFWAKQVMTEEQSKDFQCVICGEWCSPLSRHKTEIVLPVGGRDRGKLISANKSAYYSYGLKHAQIAPTCPQCEEKYGQALVQLLHNDKYRENRLLMGNLVYLFWSKQKDFPAYTMMTRPDPKEVIKLKNRVTSGGQTLPTATPVGFYALALSPNKTRIVIRDWQEMTLERVEKNVVRFLQRQRVDKQEQYYGIYDLVAALFRGKDRVDVNKHMKGNIPRYLLNHAFFGRKIPQAILHQAIQRCKAERNVSRKQAAVMRLCLLQDLTDEREDYLMTLEMKEQNQGYLCGRLFAVFEKIQLDTQGKRGDENSRSINTTLTDKYYATASTAPASIYGMLMRNAESHLSKLRKDPERSGWAINHIKRLQQISKQMNRFPTILNLQDQSMFALGYLHQRDELYTKKTNNNEEETK